MRNVSLASVILSACCTYVFGKANIRQCTCDEIETCKTGYLNSIIPCADKCRDYAGTLSADYQSLRTCFLSYEESIKLTIECTLEGLQDACAPTPGAYVEKRRSETLKTAVLFEINSLLTHSGVAGELKSVLVVGKRFIHCLRTCIDNSTGHCVQKAKCGLKLPPDNALVGIAKNCAFQNGINSTVLQELCKCAVSAGLLQLESICIRLRVD